MSVATCELPQTTQAAANDISHEVCCTDEQKGSDRISVCGQPIPDGELVSGAPDCMVCLDLLDQWAESADRYGEDPQAPDDDPCRCCPRRLQEGLT